MLNGWHGSSAGFPETFILRCETDIRVHRHQ